MSRVYRATVRMHHSDGTLVEPSVHYKVDVPAGGSEPPANDVAGDIWAHISSGALASTTSDLTIDELVVVEQVLPPDIGEVGVHVIGSAGTASVGDGHVPHGLVPIFNVRSKASSRSGRGHFAWSAPANSTALGGQVWAGAWITGYNSFGALLKDTIGMGGLFPPNLVPVVYSKTRRVRLEDPYAFDVVEVAVNHAPHWLRSRMSTP